VAAIKIPVRLIAFGTLVLCGFSNVPGHDIKLGSYSGVLDRMGAGIAELGAGNTGTARMDASPAAYWNPALLAFQTRTCLAMGSDVRTLQRNGGMLSVQGMAAPNMGVGLGIVNRGDFNVKVYDKDEVYLGTVRPQEIGSYLGIGLKTTRHNAFGVTVQWYFSDFDIGGRGDVTLVGILNFGWFHVWKKKLKTAVVIRNIGLNSKLSASYDITTGQVSNATGLDETGADFLPKSFSAAVGYSFDVMKRRLDVYLEYLDYQLTKKVLDTDRDHHAMRWRAGAEWRVYPQSWVRAGFDKGNLSLGLGYQWRLRKGNQLIFDYALLLERYAVAINPYAIGLKYEF
jgi:hypothetical protein